MAVFLFFGDDAYSLREKLNYWQSEFAKKHGGDMNITVLAGEESSARQIFHAASSMPFLSEKRLTIVENFLSEGLDEEKHSMAELLEKVPDFCTLVFSETGEVDRRTVLFKKIQKSGKLVEFTPLSGGKLLGWIEKNAGQRGGQIEKEAAIFLVDLVGSDLHRLKNEIGKLIGYANGRPITKNDIELLVNTQLSTSIFRLTDGIGHKNRKIALATLHQLIETGEDLYGILHMIMRQFRIIMNVKDLMSQGLRQHDITMKLKEHPFVVSNTMPQARNFSVTQLKRAYELLVNMDFKLKSGGIKTLARDNREFVLALDRLVLDLCG